MSSFVFINDRFFPEAEGLLSYRDLSVQRGYGIFDFFRLHEGRPLFLNAHLDRFDTSAGQMHLSIPYSRPELTDIIQELIRRNGQPRSGIRLTLTGGISPDGYTLAPPTLIVSQHPVSLPDEAQRAHGIHLLTHNHQRQLPGIKTIDYLMAIWLQPRLRQAGAEDVLYVHERQLRECPRANFFLVTQHGVLVTPDTGILRGITRATLLRLAAGQMPVEERPVLVEEIATAREAFITSTTKGILPVRSIDSHAFTLPGPCTERLNQLLTQEAALQFPAIEPV